MTVQLQLRATFNPYYLFGSSWYTGPGGDPIADTQLGTPLTISVSFLQAVPNYYGDGLVVADKAKDGSSLLELYGNPATFSALDPIQKTQFDSIFGQIAAVADIHKPSSNSQAAAGEITVAFNSFLVKPATAASTSPFVPASTLPTLVHDLAAMSFGPMTSHLDWLGPQGITSQINGDMWLYADQLKKSAWEPGSRQYWLAMHELGHALGLVHDGWTAGIPWTATRLPYNQAGFLYTMMAYSATYTAAPEGLYPITPMVYDIAQLQRLYGKNTTTNAGDTVYTFTDNSHPFADALGMAANSPYRNPGKVLMTLWDASGDNDKIDASGMSTKVLIDLTPGGMSSIGLDNINQRNVGIALDSVIESASGGHGNDWLFGNDCNNQLYGNAGDDTLDGGIGNDRLEGGADYDVYIVGNGNDTVADSDGHGRLQLADGTMITGAFQKGTDGRYTSLWDSGITAEQQGANLVVTLNNGATVTIENFNFQDGSLGIQLKNKPADITPTNTLTGDQNTDPADTLAGTAASDLIDGKTGNDTLYGAAGDDKIYGGVGDDKLSGGSENDMLFGGEGKDILNGETGDDRLYANGEVALATAIASGRTDTPTGNKGDWLDGGDGNDILIAGADNDALCGGAGKDILVGGAGDDYLNGDDDYLAMNTNWAVTAKPDNRFDPYISPVTSYNPASPAGDADVLYGGAGNDTLGGLLGNDTLYGEDGNDILAGCDDDDVLFGGNGDDYLTGDYGMLAYSSGDVIVQGNDYLDGEAGNDWLQGEAGDDILYGGTGNDSLMGDASYLDGKYHGADLLDGEEGDDTLKGQGGDDVLIGGDGNDVLDGDDDPAVLAGQYHGNDDLDGGAGNDTLTGGGGNDNLAGGDGNDVLNGDDGSSPLAAQYHGNDTLDGGSGDDNLSGNGGNDLLLGGDGADSLFGGTGNDTLFGDAGCDYLDGGNGDDYYEVAAGDGPRSAGGAVEAIQDAGGNDTLAIDADIAGVQVIGNDLSIAYGNGDAIVVKDGAAGAIENFEVNGQAMSFARFIGNYSPTPVYTPTQAAGGYGDDTLGGSGGGMIFSGGMGNDVLAGDGGGNTYLFDPGDGRDTITDSSRYNTLRFGEGLSAADMTVQQGVAIDGKRYLVLSFGSGDQVAILDGEFGTISQYRFSDGTVLSNADILSGVSSFDSIGHSGDDLLTGSPGNDSLSGAFGNDTLVGADGNDVLFGGEGDDVLLGGNGDDNLDGSWGNDVLTGGAGVDTYWMAQGMGNDTVVEDGNAQSILKLANGMALNALQSSRFGSDLVLAIKGGGGSSALSLNNDSPPSRLPGYNFRSIDRHRPDQYTAASLCRIAGTGGRTRVVPMKRMTCRLQAAANDLVGKLAA